MARTRTLVVAGLVATGTLAGGLALSRTLELGPYHTPPPSVPDAAVRARAAELADQQERLEEALGIEPPPLPELVTQSRQTVPGVHAPGRAVPRGEGAAPVSSAGSPGSRVAAGGGATAVPAPPPAPAGTPARPRQGATPPTTTGGAPSPTPAPAAPVTRAATTTQGAPVTAPAGRTPRGRRPSDGVPAPSGNRPTRTPTTGTGGTGGGTSTTSPRGGSQQPPPAPQGGDDDG